MNRREFILVGGAGGMSLPSLLQAKTAAPKAQSVIQIFLPGGMSHQDSWDYKPHGSSEYRGPFEGIKTKIDDVFFGELLKETVKISDNLTVIHSMTHGDAAHERGVHDMLTGYRPSPALKYPSYGSVISHELGSRNKLPPYVVMPNVFAPENGTGYMSSSFGPFAIGSNPEDKGFQVRDLNLPNDVTPMMYDRRKTLLSAIDEHFKSIEKTDSIQAMDSFYDQAYGLISSQSAREAFDLSKESDALKDSYGRNAAGQRFLLSRRLVEAGVRMVTVTYGGWDHHSNLKSAYISNMVNFDKAFAALITDLKQRGLLDSTLVMVTSEFGRGKMNQYGGRDHHSRSFSVVLAGGGIKKGFVYGSTDALGLSVDENPVSPEDLFATAYNLVGIDHTKRLLTDDMRPVDIIRGGNILTDIIC